MNERVKNLIIYIFVFSFVLECITHLDTYIDRRKNPPFNVLQKRDSLGIKGVKYGQWRGFRLNKYGFNDSDDFEKDRKNHAVRIMCLGDSVTFGSVSYPYNWPNFLEQILQSKGFDIEVINTAMPGNTYSDIVKRFEAEYLEFKPDIVIMYKGFGHYMKVSELKNPEFKLMTLFRKSAFMKKCLDKRPQNAYLRLRMERKRKNIKTLTENITEQHLLKYRRDLEHLINVCKNNNIVLILSPYPFLVSQSNKVEFIREMYVILYYFSTTSVDAYIQGISLFNQVTHDVAKENNVLFIDITEGMKQSKEYFTDVSHLTKKGTQHVAQKYAAVLESSFKERFN